MKKRNHIIIMAAICSMCVLLSTGCNAAKSCGKVCGWACNKGCVGCATACGTCFLIPCEECVDGMYEYTEEKD